MSARPDFWFFIHIPKCAGTTFTQVLHANFGSAFGDGRSFLSDRQFKYNAEHLQLILMQFESMRCFSDHKLTIDLPWDSDSYQVRAIAFIRSPVERLISHYNYCRYHRDINFDPEARQHSFSTYVQEVVARQRRADLWNGQTFHLTGRHDETGLERVQQLVTQGRLLLAPLDRFHELCVLLETLHARVFSDCSYLRSNVGGHDPPELTKQTKESLAEATRLDQRLYAFAERSFQDHLDSTFSPEQLKSASQNLSRRCEQLRARRESLSGKVRSGLFRLCERLLKERGRDRYFAAG